MIKEINVKKPILFTGITPTGLLTIGHYFGIINNIKKLKNDYEVIIMIADLHALTTMDDNFQNYSENSKNIASLLVSCGLEDCKIFIQSEVQEHLFFSHILSSYSQISKLRNMIQYKEKKKENGDGNLSILSYPVLMAADIFIYDAELVIVGEDQEQHLEFTKILSKRISKIFSVKLPSFFIPKKGGKIMGMKNPNKKMSKSGNDYISLLDDKEKIEKMIMKVETDSENKIHFDPVKKPGISNLILIFSLLENKEIKECEKIFEKINYHQFKKKVSERLNLELSSIRKNFDFYKKTINKKLYNDNKYIKIKASKKILSIKKAINL